MLSLCNMWFELVYVNILTMAIYATILELMYINFLAYNTDSYIRTQTCTFLCGLQ